MTFNEVSKLVADAAPLIGSAIGGPAGLALGSAVKVLAGLFGLTKDNPTPEELATAIRQDPEMNLKLRQADYAFLMEMRRQDNTELDLKLKDVQNARGRDVSIQQAGKMNIRADLMLVCAFIIVALIAYLLAVGHVNANTGVGGFLIGAGGMFVRNIGTAFDFEFGSSRGSKDKDDTLIKMANGGGKPS